MIFFDATKYRGRSPGLLRSLGLHPCVCETHVKPGETVDEAVQRWADEAYESRALLALDFENFPSLSEVGTKVGDAKLDEIAHYVDVARRRQPTVRIGNYHLPWYDRENYDRDERGRFHWRGLTDRLDVAMPAVYVAHDHTEHAWREMVDYRLEKARRFNKPTYAFLNPTLVDEPYGAVPDDVIRSCVAYLREHADGIIWFGGYSWVKWPDGGGYMSYERFDPDAAWVRLSAGE